MSAKHPEVIDERFEVLQCLGQGGIGIVYEVRDLKLGGNFALKMLQFGVSESAILRFQTEARVIARLQHPNIIEVRDFGVAKEGMPYLLMEMLRGETLSYWLNDESGLPLADALSIALEVCDGISYAHQKGILHRDIKPSNLLILSEPHAGRLVKILDFGVAKIQSDSQDLKLTNTGDAVGTPYYASPEQSQGGAVDERTDVYSIGCLIFKLITGNVPFRGETALETLRLKRSESPPSISEQLPDVELPDRLSDLISRCLQFDPNFRVQDIESLKTELEEIYREIVDDWGESRQSSVLQSLESSRECSVTFSATVPFEQNYGGAGMENSLNIPNMLSKSNSTGRPSTLRYWRNPTILILATTLIIVSIFLSTSGSSLIEDGRKESVSLTKTTASQALSSFKAAPESYQNVRIKPNQLKVSSSGQLDLNELLQKWNAYPGEIRTLNIEGTRLGEDAFSLLPDRGLLKLKLISCPMDVNVLKSLSHFQKLRRIDIQEAIAMDSSIRAVPSFAPLEDSEIISVELSRMPVSNEQLREISLIKKLELLNLVKCSGLKPDGLRHLRNAEKLRWLRLSSDQVSGPNIEALSVCRNPLALEVFDLKEGQLGLVLPVINRVHSIQSFTMGACNVTAGDIELLAESQSVKNVGFEDVTGIDANVLAALRKFRVLDNLAFIKIRDTDISAWKNLDDLVPRLSYLYMNGVSGMTPELMHHYSALNPNLRIRFVFDSMDDTED